MIVPVVKRSKAKENKNGPTFIEVKTVIGFGSKNQGTNKVHGAPIGKEDFAAVKKASNWEYEDFEISDDVYDVFNENIVKNGQKSYEKWENILNSYRYTIFIIKNLCTDIIFHIFAPN